MRLTNFSSTHWNYTRREKKRSKITKKLRNAKASSSLFCSNQQSVLNSKAFRSDESFLSWNIKTSCWLREKNESSEREKKDIFHIFPRASCCEFTRAPMSCAWEQQEPHVELKYLRIETSAYAACICPSLWWNLKLWVYENLIECVLKNPQYSGHIILWIIQIIHHDWKAAAWLN